MQATSNCNNFSAPEDESWNERVKSARMCIACFSLFIVYNNYKIIAQRNERLGRASSPRDAQLQDLFIFIFFFTSFFSIRISGYFVSG